MFSSVQFCIHLTFFNSLKDVCEDFLVGLVLKLQRQIWSVYAIIQLELSFGKMKFALTNPSKR